MDAKKRNLLIPLLALGGFILIAYLITSNPPEAERTGPASRPQLSVEALRLAERPYRVLIQSYGTVRPRVESQLIAQVSGQIVSVSPQFRNGGFFESGDVLVKIDDRDYLAEVSIAQAALTSARQVLAEEQARAAQALEDWQRLGNGADAPALVLRKPQLQAAQAQVVSAQSSLEMANLKLERTRIVAPFAGRILDKKVDVGEVVSPNTPLAEIYATDYVEIRLPLKNRDLDFIKLPENYRFSDQNGQRKPAVTIYSELVGKQSWQGEIVRTEGAIDGSSRQLHVVAQIDDPYGAAASGRQPLKIGEYVTAQIEGERLDNALVIPNAGIYQGSYVYLVKNGLLERREIKVAWQNEQEAVVRSGLQAGEMLVLTPLGQVASGVPVRVSAEKEVAVSAEPDVAPEQGDEQ